MVHFGQRLARERWAPWSSHYFDYDLLKRKLKAIQNASEQSEKEQAIQDFQHALDREIEKVLGFYKEKSGAAKGAAEGIQRTTQIAIDEASSYSTIAPEKVLEHLNAAFTGLRPIALDVFHLLGYVSLNMAGFRKMLKKYAKNVEPTKPQPGYLTLRVEHPHEPGWQMLQGTFLKEAIGKDLESMGSHEALNKAADKIRETYRMVVDSKASYLKEHPELDKGTTAETEIPKQLSPDTVGRSLTRKLSSRTSFKYTPAWKPGQLDEVEEIDLEELLEQMKFALEMADRNARLIHPTPWQEAQAGIFEPAPAEEDAIATTTGLLLNCINSGLYMANYNLILPPITEVCRHIGVKNSMVGIIVGACDIATVFGTVGYSIWTNTNYKNPLIASAVACLLGNVCYCLSYDLGAVWLLFLARLITGFGSARTVNRRYIALFVAYKDRTWASALFVSLSAVGMALGPLLSLPLSLFPTRHFAGLTFDHITMGGWIMNIAWLIFAVWAWVAFEDPLKVQKKRDELRQPLLSNGHYDEEAAVPEPKVMPPPSSSADSDDEEDPQEHSWWEQVRHMWSSPLMATACCIFLCYILKVLQQAYIDGLPIFTQSAYGWSNSEVGIMLGILGLTAPIVNTIVGSFSSRVPDRYITVASIVIAGGGAFALMKGPFPMSNFFVAGTLVYMGTIVLEGVSMSLTSKVIDERMSKGLWNAGLLSTQAGTIGRLCGNLLLSLCARITGAMDMDQINAFARLLYGLGGATMVVSLAYVFSVFGRLLG
ncbi:g10545 [Coccomyxa viridis]|uniref:G10545 protein n=1 Tax=Coccomyxa viridis TaxID=1274662 RepID=A0ABP1G5Y6_9CHLO